MEFLVFVLILYYLGVYTDVFRWVLDTYFVGYGDDGEIIKKKKINKDQTSGEFLLFSFYCLVFKIVLLGLTALVIYCFWRIY